MHDLSNGNIGISRDRAISVRDVQSLTSLLSLEFPRCSLDYVDQKGYQDVPPLTNLS